MRQRKRALLLVPVLLVVAFAQFALAGTVVEYTYDADGNLQDASSSSALARKLLPPLVGHSLFLY